MIDLHVKPVCHGCPNFTPDLIDLYVDEMLVEQHVICLNQKLCNRIELRIRKELEKEYNNEK